MMENTSPTPLYDFLRPIQEEFNACMLGEYIGKGDSRVVYAHPTHPEEFVLKIQYNRGSGDFCNQIEWCVWNNLQNTEAGSWLAPCELISASGNILVQHRVSPIDEAMIPTRVPFFLADMHKDNWGLYEDRPVMFDYGFLYGFTRSAEGKRLRMIDRMKA